MFLETVQDTVHGTVARVYKVDQRIGSITQRSTWRRIMKVKTALLSMVVVSVVLEVTAAGMLDVDSGKLDQFLTSAKWPRGAACLAAVLPKAHPKYTKCLGISRYLRNILSNGCQGCSSRENTNINKLVNAMKSDAPGMYAVLMA
ncbi:hypothetical protein C7M84_011502 [Penaeus vannamei]|uniref:Uncharacterized protein n=1 Tax=Penaeus vannamei TaxID=6689 RepID=A0A423T172_PENVA|nr:uncharacterized protein LOC113813692 [Penaeus vannamei]ROT70220.1 hypothetical protein C7M84_011502 [Penaeus vannamei]